jgi:hypothetical protein
VAEKKERRVHEWETKLQRDKKYVNKDALFFSFDFINSIIIVDNNNILTALTILSFFFVIQFLTMANINIYPFTHS